MTEQVTQIKGEFHDVLVISELRGDFPNVAIASGIDMAGLTAGDDNPVFLTIPVGKANVKSGNKRFYDEAWLQELERQTLANRPVGLMGHLSEADRSHAMPVEAVHWVGVLRVADTLWAKGYLPIGESRQRIQRYKSQGKKLATSIDCYAEGTYDPVIDAHRMDAKTMRLGQIDIAPAERAGLPELSVIPMLTSELKTEQVEQIQEEPIMAEKDKLTIIQELTSDDARLLPDSVRAAILATVTPPATPPEVGQMADLRTALGVDDKADVKAMITEMQTAQATARKAAVTSRITELVTSGEKLELVRQVVREMVEALHPQTVQEAEDAYKEISARESVTRLRAATVREIMGPRQGTPVAGQAKQNTYFQIPQEA